MSKAYLRPGEITWADGYGNWHALVAKDRDHGHILVARYLIREELLARGEKFTASKIIKNPLHDTETHEAYREVPRP